MTINADSQNVNKWRKMLISVYLFWKKKMKNLLLCLDEGIQCPDTLYTVCKYITENSQKSRRKPLQWIKL